MYQQHTFEVGTVASVVIDNRLASELNHRKPSGLVPEPESETEHEIVFGGGHRRRRLTRGGGRPVEVNVLLTEEGSPVPNLQ